MPTTQLEQLERIADAFESIADSHARIANSFTHIELMDTTFIQIREACERFQPIDFSALPIDIVAVFEAVVRIADALEESIPTKE
jgi:hypothetical protein